MRHAVLFLGVVLTTLLATDAADAAWGRKRQKNVQVIKETKVVTQQQFVPVPVAVATYAAPVVVPTVQSQLLLQAQAPAYGGCAYNAGVSALQYGTASGLRTQTQTQTFRTETQLADGGGGGGGAGGVFGFIEQAVASVDRLAGGSGNGDFLRGAITARFLPGGGGFRFKR